MLGGEMQGGTAPPRGAVRRALVVANLEKADVRAFQARLLPWLEARLERVEFQGDARAFGRARAALTPERAAADLPDLCIVLGGDGAILGAIRAFADHPVPTIGINFGRVGFLASVPARHWEEALAGLLAGHGVSDPRMRIEARLQSRPGGERAVALNDVVVARGAAQGMLTMGLHVDGRWVADYRADGLIVATPSGSTGHALSAGGPILEPSMQAWVVCPICPQGLSYRPLVLHADSPLEIEVQSTFGLTTLAVDGQGFHPMRQGDRVRLTRHPVPYPLLAWAELDPYRRLRERLGWSGQLTPGPAREQDSPGPEPDSDHGGVL